LLWVVTAAAGSVQDAEGAKAASLDAMLAEALEANRQLSELVSAVAENARLRARGAERDAEFERMRADLADLRRMELIRALYAAHDRPAAAWQENAAPAAKEKPAASEKEAAAGRMEKAREVWDSAIGAIDEARKEQAQAPGLQELDECGRTAESPSPGRPWNGYLPPWNASPDDLSAGHSPRQADNTKQETRSPAWPTPNATPTIGTPFHRTFEYLATVTV
jgi:hypothetical protein